MNEIKRLIIANVNAKETVNKLSVVITRLVIDEYLYLRFKITRKSHCGGDIFEHIFRLLKIISFTMTFHCYLKSCYRLEIITVDQYGLIYIFQM